MKYSTGINTNISQRQMSHVFGDEQPSAMAMGSGFSTESMEGSWAERDVDPTMPTTAGLDTSLASQIYSHNLASPIASKPVTTPLTKPVEDTFKV